MRNPEFERGGTVDGKCPVVLEDSNRLVARFQALASAFGENGIPINERDLTNYVWGTALSRLDASGNDVISIGSRFHVQMSTDVFRTAFIGRHIDIPVQLDNVGTGIVSYTYYISSEDPGIDIANGPMDPALARFGHKVFISSRRYGEAPQFLLRSQGAGQILHQPLVTDAADEMRSKLAGFGVGVPLFDAIESFLQLQLTDEQIRSVLDQLTLY